MKRAIFLDRDGTLNEDIGYAHKLEDYELLPGVIEGLKRLKEFTLFIITNQSGIGRGYFKEEDMHEFNNHMLDEFKKESIEIEKVYFCPHAPEENCTCRKPSARYIKEAEKEYGINLAESYVIGDHAWDIVLAKNAGCKGVYLLTGHGVKHLDDSRKANPDYIAANFKQSVDYILSNNKSKIILREELAKVSDNLRKMGKKIVTINGAFDILHEGHEKILKEAKKQGDVLIIGLNSDSSIKQNKGEDRPINNENNRAKMLANFDFVDYVTIFDEKTPIGLLEIIKPNVHVNGSDYGKECIEAETVRTYGGKIHIVTLLKGHSTTKLIKRKPN